MSIHGSAINDIILPRSRFYHGPFGRMFRNLPPYMPENGQQTLATLAETMIETDAQAVDPFLDNSDIPAGYTYFGQFVDHDITFDPTSSLQRFNDPNKLRNFRTPRLDLDNLYGNGPDDTPFMYDKDQGRGILLVGAGPTPKESDLPRNDQGIALIGDKRNDENTIVSQLQLAFIKFHNRVMDFVGGNFVEAQRLVRWHYQWVVLHDFLKRIVGADVVDQILFEPDCPGQFNLCFYKWQEQPFIPVEFSVAAYRLGHSMVRPTYDLSFLVTNRPIFSPNENPGELDDLRGFRPLPNFWTLQWDMFLKINGSDPQKSRKLDTLLSPGLGKLAADIDPDRPSLALLNLLRGWRMELPSGQTVAKAMGLEPIDGNDPLWFYILKEAQQLNDGKMLGPVGGRIVAEVFVGLLAGDPYSFLNVEPNWTPEFDREGPNFELRDILRLAGVPLTKQDLLNQAGFPDPGIV